MYIIYYKALSEGYSLLELSFSIYESFIKKMDNDEYIKPNNVDNKIVFDKELDANRFCRTISKYLESRYTTLVVVKELNDDIPKSKNEIPKRKIQICKSFPTSNYKISENKYRKRNL